MCSSQLSREVSYNVRNKNSLATARAIDKKSKPAMIIATLLSKRVFLDFIVRRQVSE